VDPAEKAAQWPARPLALDVGARRFDELAVGHTRGADGLTGATAEAEVEVRDGRVGQGKASLGERLDEEDPASRRIHLGAEHVKGRAIGEAEAAMHAAVDALDVVAVERERPG